MTTEIETVIYNLNEINRRLEAIENKLEKTDEALRKASSILDFLENKFKYGGAY